MKKSLHLFVRTVALWCACTLASTLAQELSVVEHNADKIDRDFLLRVWETADGTLPTTVRSITQTQDGYVWMAAYDGFVRFDGARAVIYSGKNTTGLPVTPKGYKVFADSHGLLWASTLDGRLFSFEQAGWREYRAAHGWQRFRVETITENADGRLIFAGADKVVQFANGRFEAVPLPVLPADFKPPLKAVFDATGKLWLGSPSHVWREERAADWKLICSAAPLESPFMAIAPARESGVWVATGLHVRRYVDETPVTSLRRPEGFRGEELALLEDFHGNLWAGSPSKGIRVWTPDEQAVKVGHTADSLSPQITCLFEDRERNVLVGTDGAGLARFKPRPFTAWFGHLGGLAGALINSIGEDPPGRILVGTEGSGLRRVGGGKPPALIATTDGLLDRKHRVTSLLRTRDGEMLAAVVGTGLVRMDGDIPVPIAESLKGEVIRALFEDSKGRLWVGHDRGIAFRENGQFTRLPAGDSPALTIVRGIAEDHEGTMWFTAKEGLARWANGKLELVPLRELGGRTNLLGLFVDHTGALWIGAESKGLLRMGGGNVFLYTTDHGLPITAAGAFIEDGDYLWVSGEKGIVRINHASLDAVAERRASRLELQLFNRADGLPIDACRRGYQPAAFRASDGQLWFAAQKGAISVRPQDITSVAFEPSANIEEIRAEREVIAVTPANRDHIEVPAGTRHMTIRCSVPSLGKPDYARFQYTLEGFDDVWRDAGGERVIRFYDVHPGRYRFLVRAIGTDGRFVEKPSSVVLIVHPFFWQELWFRTACIAALVIAVACIVWRIQQQRIRRREEKLHSQKSHADIAKQLQQSQKMDALGRLAGGIAHDFNNLLTSVCGNAELLQAELPAKSHQREIVNDIVTAAGRARELVSQILTFSRGRTVEKVALDPTPVLREAVQFLRVGLPAMIDLQVDVPDVLPSILGDAAQLQRVIMNLGTNAAQAIGGKMGRICISAQECRVQADKPGDGVPSGKYLRMMVSDNGRGMDDRTLSRIFDPFFTTKAVGQGTGLGLSVVHGIVESYGGHITVESQLSVGTAFYIYFPITQEAPQRADAPLPAEPASEPPAAEGIILLVDDEAVVLKVSRAMLERLGYRVESYIDPLAAADAFHAAPNRYSLLLTDFAMPKLDGVKLARCIWDVRPGFPAILYTGYGGRLTAHEAVRMGFVDLLAKPFTMQKLGEAVALALKPEEIGVVENDLVPCGVAEESSMDLIEAWVSCENCAGSPACRSWRVRA
jgi:signal transduction histidine kinase/ligand-binding sensor domain-containing protein/CheY-like chemotaxis protein